MNILYCRIVCLDFIRWLRIACIPVLACHVSFPCLLMPSIIKWTLQNKIITHNYPRLLPAIIRNYSRSNLPFDKRSWNGPCSATSCRWLRTHTQTPLRKPYKWICFTAISSRLTSSETSYRILSWLRWRGYRLWRRNPWSRTPIVHRQNYVWWQV